MLIKRDTGLMLIGVILSIIAVYFPSRYNLFVKSLENYIPYKWILILCLLLMILLSLVVPYIILKKKEFSNKPNLKNYTLINPPGLMKHKATENYYCQPCLIERNILSEVSIKDPKEWICRCCKETYKIKINDFLACNSFFSKLTNSLKETIPENKIEDASNAHKDISANVKPFSSEEKILEDFNVPPPFPIDEYFVKPMPIEILNDIRLVKPFDREHRQNSYIGLKVQWKGLFSNVLKDNDKSKYHIMIKFKRSLSDVLVQICVERDNYPKIRQIDENTPFWVCGEIESVDTLYIRLKNAQIKL